MKVGDSVKVKERIKNPYYEEMEIAGWQGRVVELTPKRIVVELDSVTLSGLSDAYIMELMLDEVDFSVLMLGYEEVEQAEARDTVLDTSQKKIAIVQCYSVEDADKRLARIFRSKFKSVNENNLEKYHAYLKATLTKPCILCGSEDFDWEEPFLFGGGDAEEYEELKKTNVSYTDELEYVKLMSEISADKGVYVQVRRVSDGQLFELPLWDLKTVNIYSLNNITVSDYVYWMSNFMPDEVENPAIVA